jgi:hypothetical protein
VMTIDHLSADSSEIVRIDGFVGIVERPVALFARDVGLVSLEKGEHIQRS